MTGRSSWRCQRHFMQLVVSLLIVIVSARVQLRAYQSGGLLNHVAGTVVALAGDFTRGEFYRPVLDTHGWGGTRYMPLHPLLHAGLMRLGMTPILAGHVLAWASGVLLASMVFCTARVFRARTIDCIVLALMSLACYCVQCALGTIRSDLLAAGLSAAGAYVALRHASSTHENARSWPMLAGALFALAFVAKLTSFFGLVAVGSFLLFERRRREAIWLAISFALLASTGLGLVIYLSNGRMLDSFRAVATGGGLNPLDGFEHFGRMLLCPQNEMVLVIVCFAGFSWRLLGTTSLRRVPEVRLGRIYFLATLAATYVILTSRGTDSNHLIDLYVASVILITPLFVTAHRFRRYLLGAATVALGWAIYMWPQYVPAGESISSQALAFHRSLGAARAMHEHALFDAVDNCRPFVLDAFSVKQIIESQHPLAHSSLQEVRDGKFDVITLFFQADSAEGAGWYDGAQFGRAFRQAILDSYRLDGTTPCTSCPHGHLFVYRPVRALHVP